MVKGAHFITVQITFKALKGIVGEPKSVTKLRSSELLVECCSEAQVKRLGKIDTFANIPVTVKAHRSLNSSRGVVRSRDLETTSEEEMVEELDGVTHARRIFVRKGGDKVRTNTFVLTFDSTSPPTSLKVGGTEFESNFWLITSRTGYIAQHTWISESHETERGYRDCLIQSHETERGYHDCLIQSHETERGYRDCLIQSHEIERGYHDCLIQSHEIERGYHDFTGAVSITVIVVENDES
ncbi:hypothetical protein EGW08_018745 [Elysia chlorotica]|uniref:Uncharacterized protein n=1 Tax=Elysia chlorotica TaxID=188477 RepID=A0A433SW47_ELYCH|nr:hypothetical protein EGW08_018745 [Elysia chlorotica]